MSLLMCVGFKKLQWLQEPLTFKIAHVIYFVKDKENSRQFFLSFHMWITHFNLDFHRIYSYLILYTCIYSYEFQKQVLVHTL